jgi:hypothetical protein
MTIFSYYLVASINGLFGSVGSDVSGFIAGWL